jgi:hypothetical protein
MIVAAFILLTALASGEEFQEDKLFDYSATAKFHFSSQESQDLVTAEIVGTSCEAANVRIDIRNSQNAIIYGFVRELDRFIPCSILESQPSMKDELCQRLVDRVVTDGVQLRTRELQSKEELSSLPLGGCWTTANYESIRERDLAMLCHTTANEHNVCIVLIPETSEVITVTKCSM